MKNPVESKPCFVTWSAEPLREKALLLAAEVGLPAAAQPPAEALLLELTAERLQLRSAAADAPGAVYVDFGHLDYRRRQSSLRKEAIARAVGLRGDRETSVLDATAGLGRDAFMLASLGARVTLIERSPIVAALLEDGLQRAAGEPELTTVLARMALLSGEAETVLAEMPDEARPEVVYLDPMYPESGTRAQVKKEMQLLRHLLGADPDPADLLAAALRIARRRVVVKRPLKAPPVSGRKPSHQISGRSTRFDVYVIAAPDTPRS